MEFEKFLNLLFSKFRIEKIKYGVLRNYESLPFYNSSNDIDILIGKKNIDVVIKIIQSFSEIDIINICKRTYVTNIYIYNIIDKEKRSLQLDLVSDLQLKKINYLNVEDILKETTPYRGFQVVSKYNESLILFWSKYISHNFIKEEYLEFMKTTFSENTKRFNSDLSKYYSLGDSSKGTNVDLLFGIKPSRIRNHFISSNFIKNPLHLFYKYLLYIIHELYLRHSLVLRYLIVVSPEVNITGLKQDLKNTCTQFIVLDSPFILLNIIKFYLKPVLSSTTFIFCSKKSIPVIYKQFYLRNIKDINEYVKVRSKGFKN